MNCKHESITIEFDEEAAKEMTSNEVQTRYPRFNGMCPDCGCQLIKYASEAHYIYGDW